MVALDDAVAEAAEDDVVLLCSDGFWGPLTQRQLLMGVIGKDLLQPITGRVFKVVADEHADPELREPLAELRGFDGTP